jgi:hypothetical protein
MKIELYIASPKSLIMLCKKVVDALDKKRCSIELVGKDKQLKEISRSIEKLEKLEVAVPEQLRSLKSALITEVSARDEANRVFEDLATGFNDIIKDIRTRIDKPYGKKRVKIPVKRSNQPKTDRKILRAEIIYALKTLGGRGSPQEVEAVLEQRLKGKFLPRDLEMLRTGEMVWKNNAAWERNRMVNEGILRKDSPRAIWELNKEYL